MKVKVDKELCTGDAICVDIAPDVFELNADNIAEVLVDEVPEELQDAVRDAAESCPENCIIIEE
jgi:ferredoxin